MRNINKLLFICVAALFMSCETDPILAPGNLVSFEETSKSVNIDVGASVSDQFDVYTGGVAGADRTYNLIVDESTTIPMSSLTLPSTVVVPAGSNEATVDFTIDYNDDFSITGGTLVVRLERTAENQVSNSTISILVSVVCDTPAVVSFEFDGYADETSWTITDLQDNVLYSGGGYSRGQATASREVCLADGTYKFVVNDSFGDGLSFPNIGTASVSFGGTTLVEAVGDFGAQFVGEFSIQN
ncbi:DUF1735 domain-containing protein [Psychroflexus sp. YR1-1]|uniref:DUF1735 domain-containing protein n=1 Tax=Psychroflexus aurantiacus TaxID=2709310 RepID=A0A6B3R6I6_9FLAO|nr:DUF1735 domain-containing protein [Psychroflexus aurantiacus]NEV94775.1 DUF1735 domain-containing protein [Psychroflexus aurantiacus]